MNERSANVPELEETPGAEAEPAPAAPASAPEGEAVVEAAPAEDGGDVSEDTLRAEIEDLNGRYLRLAADFDNYRKRMSKERVELVAGANAELVTEILPVLDNLERAIAAGKSDDGGGSASVTKGVELTLKMFQGILHRAGVDRIKAVGEPFDPHRHEALVQEESDEVEAETVADELEPGYTMNGRVLRPTRVKVRKPKAREEEAKPEEAAPANAEAPEGESAAGDGEAPADPAAT